MHSLHTRYSGVGLAGFCACLVAFVAPACADEVLAVVVEKHKETITFNVGETKPRKVFTLDRPDRLVIDLPAQSRHSGVSLPSGYKGKLIAKLRYGRFDANTSRFVFETSKPVKVLEVHEAGKKDRQLVVTIASGDSDARADKAASDTGRDETQASWPKAVRGAISQSDYSDFSQDEKETRQAKEPKARKETTKKETGKKETAESKVVQKAAVAVEKKERKAARKSGKPVIVIDPGHGGMDPGAEGASGTHEKDIVLTAAKDLQARLMKSGRYKVVMTREADTFVMLRKRVEIARKAGADLFISIHADSAEDDDARGLSVYTLSEKASDEEAEALAARENKSDIIAGVDLSDEREDVAGILISLAERETKNRSATLADMLVTSLDDRVRLLPNSHRFAGFAVLKAPDVPSVLVEIGFLSHPKEEKLITSKAYREKVAAGIVEGVDRYFRQQGIVED